MKRILVTGSGGSPATGFVRSLRAAPEEMFLVGTDCSEFYVMRSETDETFLVPRATEGDYIAILNQIIEENELEFLHVQNTAELKVISDNRKKLNITTFLPSKKTIHICQNKLLSHEAWASAGIKQPKTMMINDESDLKVAFKEFGKPLWIRDTTGAGGRGSLPVKSLRLAKAWLDFKEGWGKYTAAEMLGESKSTTWQSIWKDGELIVAQGRRRLYWELAKLAPSGISGATGTGITVSDEQLDDMAQRTIFAIDKDPHGIFSVDLTYNKEEVPNPTEINIGRFFTTHEFFTQAGLNMPYVFVRLAYGESVPEIKTRLNPLPNNLAWIRGMDFKPILTTMNEINSSIKILERRRNRL